MWKIARAGTIMFAILIAGSLLAVSPNQAASFEIRNREGESVSVRTLNPEHLNPNSVLQIQQSRVPRPAYPCRPGVLLANGDYLTGRITAGTAKSLKLLSRFGSDDHPITIEIPLSAIVGIWIEEPTEAGINRVRWNLEPVRGDRLVLANRDTIRGTFLSADESTVHWKSTGDKNTRYYEHSTVSHLLLDPSLARMKPPRDAHFRCITRNGTRVALAEPKLNELWLEGLSLFGARLVIPLADVVALDAIAPGVVSLAGLQPVELQEKPYNTLTWPMKIHRNVEDLPLLLQTERGAEAFDFGLGLHSESRVTYELPKQAGRFDAQIGLDAACGRRGCVDVRVLLDGQEHALPQLRGLKFGPAFRLSLPVANVKRLTLAVDFGPGGDIQDVVNVVQPVIVLR